MPETGQDFAARFWGGEGVTPTPRPADYGPRNIDGGRVAYPAGWRFDGDGFRYRVWVERANVPQVWHMEASDGGYARWYRDGDMWVLESHGDVRRVPVLDADRCQHCGGPNH